MSFMLVALLCYCFYIQSAEVAILVNEKDGLKVGEQTEDN